MTRHSLESGQEVVDSLLALGKSLGYLAESEWRIEPGTAAIDVAWLRRPSDRVPLMAFEVETTASAGIAANAIKVLGKDSSQLRKPLHLFHVVVRGGLASDRPTDVAAEFASHNYSIHLLEEEGEPLALFKGVLDVHSRIADRIDGELFAPVVASPPWPASLLREVVIHVEELHLKGLSERCLTLLARRDPERFLPILVEHLQKIWHREIVKGQDPPDLFLEPAQPREEPYGSYMAEVAGEAIELGLIAALRPEFGPTVLLVLQRWQALNHIGDRLGPFTGAGVQWTQYEIEHLGFMWALIAVLMSDVPGALRWCAEQPAALLSEISQSDAGEVLLLAVWAMHIAAAAEAEDLFEPACARIKMHGGVSPAWLARPDPGAPGEDGDWDGFFDSAFGGKRVVPTATEVQEIVLRHGVNGGDAVPIALDALMKDPVYRPNDGAKVAALLAEARPS